MPPARSWSSTPNTWRRLPRCSSASRRGPPARPTTWPGTRHSPETPRRSAMDSRRAGTSSRMISERPGEGLLRARLAHDLLLIERERPRIGAVRDRPARSNWGLANAFSTGWSSEPRTSAPPAGRGDALLLLDPRHRRRARRLAGPRRRAEVFAALGRTAEREADLARAITMRRGYPVPDSPGRRAEPRPDVGIRRRSLRSGHRARDGPVRGLAPGRGRPSRDR